MMDMEKENTYKENVWVQNFSLLRLKEHTTGVIYPQIWKVIHELLFTL